MTDQEIKVKALELSVASLALLPKSEVTRCLSEQLKLGLLLPDLVIRDAGTFEKYIRSSKTAEEFVNDKTVR